MDSQTGFELFSAIFSILADTNPVVQGITLVTGVVGGASVIAKGLDKIAKITPTTKDDKVVGGIVNFLSKVSAFLDHIALNPDQDSARVPRSRRRRGRRIP